VRIKTKLKKKKGSPLSFPLSSSSECCDKQPINITEIFQYSILLAMKKKKKKMKMKTMSCCCGSRRR